MRQTQSSVAARNRLSAYDLWRNLWKLVRYRRGVDPRVHTSSRVRVSTPSTDHARHMVQGSSVIGVQVAIPYVRLEILVAVQRVLILIHINNVVII